VIKADEDELEIMKKVVTKLSPNAKFDGYTGEDQRVYVTARFDASYESFTDGNVKTQRTDSVRGGASKITDDKDDRTPAQKRNDALESRWEGNK